MKNLKSEIIKYSKMFNSKKLSALRSGNISARFKDGFLITPSGKKYSSVAFVKYKLERPTKARRLLLMTRFVCSRLPNKK